MTAARSERVYSAADWPLFDVKITRLADCDHLHITCLGAQTALHPP
jgi:pyochelin synthetase